MKWAEVCDLIANSSYVMFVRAFCWSKLKLGCISAECEQSPFSTQLPNLRKVIAAFLLRLINTQSLLIGSSEALLVLRSGGQVWKSEPQLLWFLLSVYMLPVCHGFKRMSSRMSTSLFDPSFWFATDGWRITCLCFLRNSTTIYMNCAFIAISSFSSDGRNFSCSPNEPQHKVRIWVTSQHQ